MKITTCLLVLINQLRKWDNSFSCELVSSLSAYESCLIYLEQSCHSILSSSMKAPHFSLLGLFNNLFTCSYYCHDAICLNLNLPNEKELQDVSMVMILNLLVKNHFNKIGKYFDYFTWRMTNWLIRTCDIVHRYKNYKVWWVTNAWVHLKTTFKRKIHFFNT